ncbi:hypothetical protein DYGSA30_32570 [Dyella sp. GSA-30]|nr:hypothetical protein DYGSA30_32570 [Dyella sp. GSA-30]
MIGDARFDLAQLDAKTANLDLFVVAPQVFDTAIGQPTADIASLVEARLRIIDERIGHETFGRQFRPVKVTPRHTGTTHIQLAGHTERYRFAMGVQHIDLQIGNLTADRTGTGTMGIGWLDRQIRHVHRGFGDAVHVDQARRCIGRSFVPWFERAQFERFAAEDDVAQVMCPGAVALCCDQLTECTGCLVEHRDTLRA